MKRTIGIGIDSGTVRAVMVRRDAISWVAEATWDSHASLAEGIEAVLARAPLSRWRRTPVHVAVGAFGAQVKLLAGLPAVDDPRALTAVVREGAASFFLRNGCDLVTTGVRVEAEGRAWAAAVEWPTVEAIRDACRRRGVRLRSIAPAAAVLPLAARNDRFTWRDGPLALEIGRSGSTLGSVRRIPAVLVPTGEAPLDPIEPLGALGPEALRYAAAYGATRVDARSPLAIGPDGVRPLAASTPKRRLLVPAAIGCIALMGVGLSPLASEWTAHRARVRLEEGRSTEAWHAMVASVARLERITGVLNEMDAFVASRPERTRLLADLARALPDRSAIVRLEVDGPEGSLVMVTPRATDAVASLRSLGSLASVEIVGQATTRHHAAGGELERVTVRFRLHDDASRASNRTNDDETP